MGKGKRHKPWDAPNQFWQWNSITKDEATQPVTPPEKHLVAGPTLGYRLWGLYRASQGDYRLGSVYKTDTQWLPGVPLEARKCPSNSLWTMRWSPGGPPTLERHDQGPAPHPNGACGIYAMRQWSNVSLYRDLETETVVGDLVMAVGGLLSMWGRVIEHEHGYRAQYAYPAALWPYRPAHLPINFPAPERWLEPLLRAGEAYNVPVYPVEPTRGDH